jgi:hypothetical protein
MLVSGLARNNFDNSHIGKIFTTLAILQLPLVFIMMFFGALYGHFLKNKFKRLMEYTSSVKISV